MSALLNTRWSCWNIYRIKECGSVFSLYTRPQDLWPKTSSQNSKNYFKEYHNIYHHLSWEGYSNCQTHVIPARYYGFHHFVQGPIHRKGGLLDIIFAHCNTPDAETDKMAIYYSYHFIVASAISFKCINAQSSN